MTDRHAILAATFLRALATGMMGVLLGLYLERLAYTPTEIGLVIGAGLAGAALSAAVVTFFGDALGRRRSLLVLSGAAAVGGFALLVSVNFWVVCGVAFLGMLNGMGRDRGAALVLEQAILPGIVAPERRTQPLPVTTCCRISVMHSAACSRPCRLWRAACSTSASLLPFKWRLQFTPYCC